MQPTTAVNLRPDLGGSFEEFDLEGSRQGYIGGLVLPVIESEIQNGKFGRIPVEQLLNNADDSRASGANYNRANSRFEDEPFATRERGIEEVIDHRDAKIYKEFFDAELFAAARARGLILRNREKRISVAMQATGAFANTAPAVGWKTEATAKPITDVIAATKAVWAATGIWPNAVIMSHHTFLNVIRTQQILDLIKEHRGGLPGELGIADLRLAFNIEHVFIAGGAENTANEQATSPMIASLWDPDVVGVARIAITGDIQEPCVGRTIHWAEDGSEIGAAMESYEGIENRSTIVRARMEVDEKIIYPALQHLITKADSN